MKVANFAFYVFALGPWSATDPKFELDPRKLEDRITAPSRNSSDARNSDAP
jgi:hypothetical protein